MDTYYYVVIEKLNSVEWVDLRYRKNEYFPFKVRVMFDYHGSVLTSTIGYHHNESDKNHSKKNIPVKIAKM